MKAIKYFMLAALGLGLVLTTGCEKGGDDTDDKTNNGTGQQDEFDPLGGDKRDKVAGTYSVILDTSLSSLKGRLIDITLTSVGRAAMKATGTLTVSGLSPLDIMAELSELKEFNNVDGRAATGYYFKVAPRLYDLLGQATVTLVGSGAYEYEGTAYDAMAYKTKDGAEQFFALDLTAEEVAFTLHVESPAK